MIYDPDEDKCNGFETHSDNKVMTAFVKTFEETIKTITGKSLLSVMNKIYPESNVLDLTKMRVIKQSQLTEVAKSVDLLELLLIVNPLAGMCDGLIDKMDWTDDEVNGFVTYYKTTA